MMSCDKSLNTPVPLPNIAVRGLEPVVSGYEIEQSDDGAIIHCLHTLHLTPYTLRPACTLQISLLGLRGKMLG